MTPFLIASLPPVLPTVNASLNALATVLLVAGYVLIKRKKEAAHRRAMLACFFVSVIFLVCYVAYHLQAGSQKFLGEGIIRPIYYTILISHIILAAIVPVLAIVTIRLGLNNRRESHRRWARWTFPIWLYVSVTGVLVYLFLYVFYPPPGG